MEPAVSTGRGEGTSGGILQMVPIAQGLAPVDLIPPSICGGRAVALHTPGVVPGGFLWITLYLHDSEQLSPRNWQILESVGAVLKVANMPYVVCGDFNMAPDILFGSGWPEAIDGVVLAPATATCTNSSESGGKVLDYFVVSASLQYGATVQAIVDAGTTPHMPVKLTLCSSMLMDFGYR
eukprot:1068881-Pyramimonas_sp.AAC.1